jgi:hypothetical protein
MPANARIDSTSIDDSGNFNARSMRETRMAQEQDYGPDYVDPMQFRKPEYSVYVYSVVDPRPIGKKLRRALPPLVPEMEIAELKPGETYTLVTTISHPVNQPLMRENGERYLDSHDARRLAMDLVNPDNLSLDQDKKIDPTKLYSEGNDFGKLGVFWSLHNPPKDEEIAKAIARKEDFYRARLDQARVIETSDPKALYNYISTTDHVAADYFGEEFSWHRKSTKPEVCPNCGEAIKPGAAYHKMDDGTLCINDWKRTVAAGVRQRNQVPIEKRWWVKEEPQSSRSGETVVS